MTAYEPDRARVGILADDLTSAGDAAAPFRAAGLTARVVLGTAAVPLTNLADMVVAVDLDTRGGAETSAAVTVSAAAASLAGMGILFKTVDSTVRGHLNAELTAALAAGGRGRAIVAPAFPAAGRTTVGGIQLLHGTPVHRTEFATDPTSPVHDADLRALLPGAVHCPTGTAPPAARVVLADAVTDDDLGALVAAVDRPDQVLWVGSPGLAAALARRLAPRPRPVPAAGHMRATPPVGTVYAVGSMHPVARNQRARLAASGVPAFEAGDRSIEEIASAAATALQHTSAVLIHAPDQTVAEPDAVSAHVGAVVAALRARATFTGLVLTGGATARSVLTTLGIGTFELLDEPEPGVALGRVDGLRVLLKAGGFGDPDLLVRGRMLLETTPTALEAAPCSPLR